MADKSLFSRLQRLFSTNVIVRNVGGKKLKIADTEQVQSQVKSHLIDRYSKLHSGLDMANSGYSTYAQMQATRLGLFKDYETMEADSIIASALDTYADESTMKSAYGESLEIQSDNDQIKQILHNLFYDIMNIEFNLWPWVRNMCKYGDFFLYLDISDKYGIHNVVPMSPYEIIRVEGDDPENPYYTKFVLEAMEIAHPYFARSTTNKKIEFENFQIAHFRLANDSNLLPYGKSMVESARKVWKQITLMEDAMLIHRIMRAPEKRVFKVDIGNIPPNEVDNYMQRIINKMKKTPFMDDTTGDYNLKFNIQNLTEDFFMPVRGGDSGTQVESLPGMQYETTEDIEYLKNRMLAALRIPKAFLGYEESLGCVVPETKIPLLSGEIKTVKEIISDYENGIKHYVYSINDSNMIVPGEIEWAGYTKTDAELVRVNLDNGKYIDCTPDHKFLTRDGDWIEAQDLQENQSLMPLYLDETTQKNKKGYTTVYHPETGKYQEVHRLVAEHYDMVDAGSGKVVHHRDFQKKNNYPENFDCSMDYREHRKYHSTLIEKTMNSLENIAKRVNDPVWKKSVIEAGRKGGLKSADRLVVWNKKHGVWNKGKLSGETKKCVECDNEFYTEPHRTLQLCCSKKCSNKYYTGSRIYNTKFMVEYDELVNVANGCSSLKELESKLGNIDRNTLNRIFEYNEVDKVDFIFNNMPLALQNKNFMQNYRKYEEQYLNHKVVSIEFLTETKDTCDLTITKYHNFATNAGVIIHNSKATLAAEDVRFARTIERIQRILTSELTKIAVVHLYAQGYTDEELVNFELKLTNPSTIYEQEKIELWSNKVNLARDVKDNSLMSSDWVYRNIFNFTEKEQEELEKELVEDQKQKFRYSQIENEGNDPVDSGDSVGTPSDMAAIGLGADDEAEPPETLAGSIFDKGGAPEGGFEGAGRPKEVSKYSKDGSARGRDPLGRPKIPMALAHFDRLKKSFGSKAREILKETIDSEEIDKEYKDFTDKK